MNRDDAEKELAVSPQRVTKGMKEQYYDDFSYRFDIIKRIILEQ
jgi:hypothetical protein